MMKNDEIYGSFKLKSIPISTINNMILDLVETSILDYGRSVDIKTHEHINRRALEIIKSTKYSNWTWNEVLEAFQFGHTGAYGGESRMSVSNIDRWLASYSRGRTIKTGEEAKSYSQLTPEERTESNWYAYAVHARLSRRMAGGEVNTSLHADVAELKRKYDNNPAKLPPVPRLEIAEKFNI